MSVSHASRPASMPKRSIKAARAQGPQRNSSIIGSLPLLFGPFPDQTKKHAATQKQGPKRPIQKILAIVHRDIEHALERLERSTVPLSKRLGDHLVEALKEQSPEYQGHDTSQAGTQPIAIAIAKPRPGNEPATKQTQNHIHIIEGPKVRMRGHQVAGQFGGDPTNRRKSQSSHKFTSSGHPIRIGHPT